MTTRQTILHYLTLYLNQQLTLAELVDWAETILIEPDIPEEENADRLMHVLTYLGAADTRGFPLTWEVLYDFVIQLDGKVWVVMAK